MGLALSLANGLIFFGGGTGAEATAVQGHPSVGGTASLFPEVDKSPL